MANHEREPSLVQLLRRVLGKQGAAQARESWRELSQLAGRAWKERAQRHAATIEGRLRLAEQLESLAVPVQIQDISASGVRLSLSRNTEIDVMKADRMYLHVTLESAEEAQVLGLFVSFVRVAAMADGHAELAFRFTYPSDETSRKLDRIHAHYFEQ